MNRTQNKAYNLMKEIVLNNFQWSNKRGQPKRAGGKLEADTLTLLNTKANTMTQMLGRLNVNGANSNAPTHHVKYMVPLTI